MTTPELMASDEAGYSAARGRFWTPEEWVRWNTAHGFPPPPSPAVRAAAVLRRVAVALLVLAALAGLGWLLYQAIQFVVGTVIFAIFALGGAMNRRR